MQGLYWTPLTGLKWQHGWQYAAAMALLATGSALLSRTLRRTLPAAETAVANNHVRLAVPAAVSQGLIAAGGLAALIVSGKLWSVRADWAANRVFAGLAVAILAISVATVVTGLRSRQAG